MGKLLVTLQDETEEKLRNMITTKWGGNPDKIRRGILSLVFEEAIRDWIEKQVLFENLQMSYIQKEFLEKKNLTTG